VQPCDTKIRMVKPARKICRGVSPLPYGGSDGTVLLRSLPLSTFHAILLVACTMVFFVVVARAHGDEHGVGTAGTTVLALHSPMTAAALRSQVGGGTQNKMRQDTIDAFTLHHRANRGDCLLAANVMLGKKYQTVDAVVSSRREPLDPPTSSRFEWAHFLSNMPVVSAWRTIAATSQPYSVQSANLPRLS